ncbi:unnamed protein product [Chilo suppressalis]|uniref:Peptidase M28 domain-containing protein n=1 Tax=Chilo suppressalis TaxID=168631 RepID=A0ABN8B858_CHISP|nr:unnamed protein product [Chilo suppressalis]
MNGAGDENNGLKHKNAEYSREPRAYSGVPTDDYHDVRDEKPWQRVVFEITRKGLHLYEPVKSVPSIFIILVLGLYILLGFLTQLIEDDMPRVITEAEISNDDWNTFSEESALKYLQRIIGNQPRVAGTSYHLQKTRDMYAIVQEIASQARIPIRTEWQVASGDYLLNFSSPFVNYYQNASNIIAVLEGESGFKANGETGASLLVNCHYDSVPFALGASDNAIFCACMAETLLRLSRRQQRLKYNIVFLFNGAEENPLQASHAFLQHRWAVGVTSVLNLDAAGMNGKPSVFQVTDKRILGAYARGTPRPSAQSVGEFLFTSGIIPSDTDFRIFRDFGNIQGVDVAFTKGGHVYHTRNDRPELIKTGVVQNAGNMLLGVLIAAADMDLNEGVDSTPMVYSDYLNMFVITLSYPAALGIDIMVAILALLSVVYYVWLAGPRWSTVQELLIVLLGRLAALIAGFTVVLVTTPLAVATTIQLRYLTQPWLVVAMYWLPYFIATVAAAHCFDAWRQQKSGLNRSIRTLQAMAATRLFLACLLLVMAAVPAITPLRYALSAPLLIMTMAAFTSISVVRYLRLQGYQHLILEVLLSVPSVMYIFMLALRLNSIMLPIMGRSSANYPDYLVAVINLVMAILAGITVSGVELLFSRRRLWLPLGLVGATCFILMFIPFSPYQDEGTSVQRHHWFHSEIVSFDRSQSVVERTAGVLITKHDPYTISRAQRELTTAGLALNVRTDNINSCAYRTYCDLPLYRMAFGRVLSEALFIYTSPPAPLTPAPHAAANIQCNGDICNYNFTFTVSPHNLITFQPRNNVSLLSWSLQSSPWPAYRLQDRPVYSIIHSVATYNEAIPPLRISLVLRAPVSIQSGPLLDVSLHSHLIHHPEAFTTEYTNLLASAPKYFNIASFISFRHNYVF